MCFLNRYTCNSKVIANSTKSIEKAVTISQLTDWFQIGKGACQSCILLSFNLYADYIMRNAGLEEAQAGIKIARRNNTSDMQMTPLLWQKVKRN